MGLPCQSLSLAFQRVQRTGWSIARMVTISNFKTKQIIREWVFTDCINFSKSSLWKPQILNSNRYSTKTEKFRKFLYIMGTLMTIFILLTISNSFPGNWEIHKTLGNNCIFLQQWFRFRGGTFPEFHQWLRLSI